MDSNPGYPKESILRRTEEWTPFAASLPPRRPRACPRARHAEPVSPSPSAFCESLGATLSLTGTHVLRSPKPLAPTCAPCFGRRFSMAPKLYRPRERRRGRGAGPVPCPWHSVPSLCAPFENAPVHALPLRNRITPLAEVARSGPVLSGDVAGSSGLRLLARGKGARGTTRAPGHAPVALVRPKQPVCVLSSGSKYHRSLNATPPRSSIRSCPMSRLRNCHNSLPACDLPWAEDLRSSAQGDPSVLPIVRASSSAWKSFSLSGERHRSFS